MLDRVALVADGWCASGHYTFDDYQRGTGRIRAKAAELSRDIETVSFSKVQGVSVHADRNVARSNAVTHWQRYYGPSHDVDHATTYGTPDECIADLRRYAAIDVPAITLILEPTSMSLDELALLTEVKAGILAN
jgi:alkanesulfonate monooxygenase SsuD/methylene tetrahydromethanopterin reductase-like flavin-dependent oxidoreductase (luciferase family)